MRQKDDRSSEQHVRDIRRRTRRRYSAEEKIRIVLEGLRGEASIAELCRREGISQNLYYRWSKEFLEAGKKRLPPTSRPTATTSAKPPRPSVVNAMTDSSRRWGGDWPKAARSQRRFRKRLKVSA